ncbi:MAG: TauD/TfdA family dioxygenase [Gammaproteobacteria bacterium]|nr:TauD/TfdA family dioxygenase [Gammaproteobacteria bacterium]
MPIETRPLCPAIGAELLGVAADGEVDQADFDAIRDAWLAHCIVLLRDMRFTPEQQIAFTRRFGPMHIMTPHSLNLAGHPEIFVVSNRMRDGQPVGLKRAGWGWHSDGEDKLLPNAGSLLYALAVAPGAGDTLFANMYGAYEALPARIRQRIEGRRARFSRVDLHLINYPNLAPLTEAEKRARPDVYHPLVREHPLTGRKSLYVGRWATDIEGLSGDEGRELVTWLKTFSVQPRFVYRHRWKAGDAILWDNRCTQHCAVPFDDAHIDRHMHRTTLEGDLPYLGNLRSSLVAG